MQLKPTWRWGAKEKLLIGGYCCELTPEETNRWHLLVHSTVLLERFDLAHSRLKAVHTLAHHKELTAVEKDLFKMGEAFYAKVLIDREVQDEKDEAERKKKNDEEESARVARLERDAEARG